MAEQEIAKHTKNVVSLFAKSEHGWQHKLREMALEIVTIVFAVSLSIWLHGLGEHRHEQEQVRSFLLGLRHDIGSDIELINAVAAADHGYDASFDYLRQLDPAAAPDPQKFDAAYQQADANFFFQPQLSRYQGFKSSGKLTNIEDEALLEKILNLYESSYARIRISEGGWIKSQNNFRDYLENGLDGDDSLAARYKLIVAPKGKRLLRQRAAAEQLYERYQQYAALGKEIILQIDQAYPGASGGEK